VGALERDEWRRAAWKVMVSGALDARSVVFLRTRWARTLRFLPCTVGPRRDAGPTARCPVTLRQEHHLLSSMTIEGMGPSLAVQGATTARVFETYVERVLGPTLREGRVVVMDNLLRPTKESEF